MHESEGMRHRKAGQMDSNEFYAGAANMGRSRFEDHDEMIHEDPRHIANLPQDVMFKGYPSNGPYMDEGMYDDGMSGIDRQKDTDMSQRMRQTRVRKA